MTRNEIRKIYNDKVKEFLNEGYEIYPETMGTIEDDSAHIDFVKDGEIYRLSFSDVFRSADELFIRTVKFVDKPENGDYKSILTVKTETIEKLGWFQESDDCFVEL